MTSPNENYTSWHVGMKVVFVGWPDKVMVTGGADLYSLGNVYEIEGLRAYSAGDRIFFEGGSGKIKRAAVYIRAGGRWALADGFRPVETRKTDISVFQRILSNPHKKIHKVEGERV